MEEKPFFIEKDKFFRCPLRRKQFSPDHMYEMTQDHPMVVSN